MTEKPVVYAPLPEFNQLTQAVYQGEAIDKGEYIEIGVEVKDVEPDEEVPETDWG